MNVALEMELIAFSHANAEVSKLSLGTKYTLIRIMVIKEDIKRLAPDPNKFPFFIECMEHIENINEPKMSITTGIKITFKSTGSVGII